MRTHIAVVLALGSITLLCAVEQGLSAEQNWGHLNGRFVWEGEIPNRPLLNVPGRRIEDESLLVNPQNRGVANVAVYLVAKRGQALPLHPAYDKDATQEVTVAIAGGSYDPHATVLRTTQTLAVVNFDKVACNPNFQPLGQTGFNTVLKPGGQYNARFHRASRTPEKLSNSVQPWLQSWVLISEHPYAAFTDGNGDFEIRNLPTGEWTFQVWHERAGSIESATLDGRPVQWEQGRVNFHIEPSTLKRGEISIGGTAFGAK